MAANDLEVSVNEVVDYLKITEGFSPALREVVKRKITARTAEENGITVTDEELQRAADTFRLVKGLSKAADTEDWLKSIGVSMDVFENYLELNLLMSKYKDILEGNADREKYISTEPVQEAIREMIFQEWLDGQLKD